MKKSYLLILVVGILTGLFLRDLFFDKDVSAKVVTVRSRSLVFQMETVDEDISHGVTINVPSQIEVSINDGGAVINLTTRAESVGDLLFEQQISLARTDRVTPPVNSFLSKGLEVVIDRIVDLEVVEESEIPFEIIRTNSAAYLYGNEELVSAGVQGKKSEKFLITYKNGVEVARKLLSSEILTQVVAEQRIFGTKIRVQETKDGRASWYAWKACMCAAHPFYNKGQYVRVISLESGASIIVRINDRGPDLSVHPGRVIDLDTVAYKELASLGSGTIPVRVELLKN